MFAKFEKPEQNLQRNRNRQFETLKNKNQQERQSKPCIEKPEHKSIHQSHGSNQQKFSKRTNQQTEMTTKSKSPLAKKESHSKKQISELKNLSGKFNKKNSSSNQKLFLDSKSKSFSNTPVQEFKRQHSVKKQKFKPPGSENQTLCKQSNVLKQQKKQAENKSQSKIAQSQFDYQINFPQMLTESESAYQSSPKPNTGKQSQRYQVDDGQFIEGNSNVLEQEQSQFLEEKNQDAFQEKSQKFSENSQNKANMEQISNNVKGYHQIPQSYLIAMQILQNKANEQEIIIEKLRKQLSSKKSRSIQLDQIIQGMKLELNECQKTIENKESEIKFLKGYLDEQKHNNRQALKEVAKNVYQRSFSGQKLTHQKSQNGILNSSNNPKKKLFTTNQKLDSQKKQKENAKKNANNKFIKSQQNTQQQSIAYYQNDQNEETANFHLKDQQNQQEQKQNKKQERLQANSQKISRTIQKAKNYNLQQKILLSRQKELIKEIQLERKLEEEFAQKQFIKNEIIREQILRKQLIRGQLKKDFQLKSNYLDQSRRNERAKSFKQVDPSTLKKLSESQFNQISKKDKLQREKQLYSERKSLRSFSTAAKHQQGQLNSNIVSWAIDKKKNDFSIHEAVQSKLNSKYSQKMIIDPIIQRYVIAKSGVSDRFNIEKNYTKEGESLKMAPKNKQAVSQMRQIMRAEKQLIVLNYKLEALEKKILEKIKSASKEKIGVPTLDQRIDDRVLLEDLQRQYSLMKKQFEKKEFAVKSLRIKLEGKV